MPKSFYTTSEDRKFRWGGFLENPYISRIQRALLDAGRVANFCRTLKDYCYKSVLDVGCGLGEYTIINKGMYVGLDNSLRRLVFAAKQFPLHNFMVADGMKLPFKEKSFDMVMLVDTAHHLSDDKLCMMLAEFKRVSRKFIVISDPIRFEKQDSLSQFFYRLDRGACFRDTPQMQSLFFQVKGLKLIEKIGFWTFPGLYQHVIFVLQV